MANYLLSTHRVSQNACIILYVVYTIHTIHTIHTYSTHNIYSCIAYITILCHDFMFRNILKIIRYFINFNSLFKPIIIVIFKSY